MDDRLRIIDRYPNLWAAVIFSFVVNLPFYETLLYNILVYEFFPSAEPISIAHSAYTFGLTTILSINYIALTLIGWLLMLLSFVIDKENLRKATALLLEKLEPTHKKLRKNVLWLISLIPALLIAMFIFVSLRDQLTSLLFSKLTETIFMIGLWVIIGLMVHIISKLLNLLGNVKPRLSGAIDNWSLSIKFSILYDLFFIYVDKSGRISETQVMEEC